MTLRKKGDVKKSEKRRRSRSLRRFKDSRTLREWEEVAEERPKGGCSKSRGDEGELRRLGWLTMSIDKCVLGGRMQKGSKSDIPNSGRSYRTRAWLYGNYGRKYRTYGTASVSSCRREKNYLLYSAKPIS